LAVFSAGNIEAKKMRILIGRRNGREL